MKIVGLIVILLCSVSLGYSLSCDAKETLKQLRGVIDFMYYIKSRIEYFNTPIQDIYASYKGGTVNSLVRDVANYGWDAALEKYRGRYLTDTSIEHLSNFGAHLGKSNKDEQVKHCNYYIPLIEEEYSKLEKDLPQKTKVSFTLSISGGLMLIILFI